jgi:predicted amidophosphoribosyltransferase
MKHNFSSLQQILSLFSWEVQFSAWEIAEKLGKSKVLVHRYLQALLEQKKLEKIGKTPHTKYKLPNSIQVSRDIQIWWTREKQELQIDFKTRKMLDEVFLKFSPTGQKLEWLLWFQQWCQEKNLDISQKIHDYLQIAKHIEQEQDTCGLLAADTAFGKDFEKTYLDRVLYADQYNYMDFGRGKLAELTFYAKQSQNKKLIAESISEIFPKLECLIQTEKFDAIAITPWSIERKNQLLGALKKELSLFQIPFIRVVKYSPSGIFIPQKSLKTRQERIQNAKNTIFIDDENTKNYKKILLIDDFVGSWATLNETAKKLKDQGIQEIFGFAFVGNTNLSYEVIREI